MSDLKAVRQFHLLDVRAPVPCDKGGSDGMHVYPPIPRNVLVEGWLAATSWDKGDLCKHPNGPPEMTLIMEGAAAVLIDDYPFARETAPVSHGTIETGPTTPAGKVKEGAPQVIIGGDSVAGNVGAATKACKEARLSRGEGFDPNSADTPESYAAQYKQQTYQNCGLECTRTLVNLHKQGPPTTENDFVTGAVKQNLAESSITVHDYIKGDPARKAQFDKYVEKRLAAKAAQAEWDTDPDNPQKQAKAEAAEKEKEDAYKPLQDGMEQESKKMREKKGGRTPLNKGFNVDDSSEEGRVRRNETGGTTTDDRQKLLAKNGVPSTQVNQKTNLKEIQDAIAEGRGVITANEAGTLYGPKSKLQGGHIVMPTGVVKNAKGDVVGYMINDTGKGDCGVLIPAKQFEDSLQNANANVTTKPIWGAKGAKNDAVKPKTGAQ